MQYSVMKKAGPLRNGSERGNGSVLHAVPNGSDGSRWRALCGQQSAIQCSDCEGLSVTCPACLRKLGDMTAWKVRAAKIVRIAAQRLEGKEISGAEVVRMARALWGRHYSTPWEEASVADRDEYCADARSAFEALREYH
jgi:hypothetical protein